eukprot:m.17195 g.17195  ORF g.17195 m.17195 type:complete len:254 (-) comp11164_c0_seq1:1438-2199(-)
MTISIFGGHIKSHSVLRLFHVRGTRMTSITKLGLHSTVTTQNDDLQTVAISERSRVLPQRKSISSNNLLRAASRCSRLYSTSHGNDTTGSAAGAAIGEDRRRSNEEWKKLLSSFEYDVLRCGGTERAYSGTYDAFYPAIGYFACRGCSQPLYASTSKFSSGCGWPAFDKFFVGAVTTKLDTSYGMVRREILCSACDGHLGHVFTGERHTETNQRHCVNSASLVYVDGSADGQRDTESRKIQDLPQGAFDFTAK